MGCVKDQVPSGLTVTGWVWPLMVTVAVEPVGTLPVSSGVGSLVLLSLGMPVALSLLPVLTRTLSTPVSTVTAPHSVQAPSSWHKPWRR